MLALLGLIAGLVVGSLVELPVSPWLGRYLGIALLAALDSSLGGLRASLQKTFNDRLFVAGFMTNMVMAAFIVYLGDRLGLELYLAAVVAFGVRIFRNLARIRRHVFRARRWE